MTLPWTPEQIRSHYKSNRNIQILSELNACEPKEIKEIVSDLIKKPAPRNRKPTEKKSAIHERALAKRVEWKRLYEQGMTDTEISMATLANRGQVTVWRNSENLPAHKVSRSNFGIGYTKPDKLIKREAKQMEMYKNGASDGMIAESLALCPQNVYRWRKQNGLPANNMNNEQKRNRLKTNVEGI